MSLAAEHHDHVAAERDHRLAKLADLRRRGIEPYPVGFRRDRTVAEIRGAYHDLPPDFEGTETVTVAGRLMLIRRHGGLVFAQLVDQSGAIQVLAGRDALGDDAFADVEHLDRGDWVGVTGTPVATHTGELTVRADAVVLLSKALRALPDKHRGLIDADTKLRERELDLIVTPQTRRVFAVRSTVVAAVRQVLVERGFSEVETPVLEPRAGGAAARPFVTHHHALDQDMVLRIALELSLKRLVVGGMERVFEIGRVFRNEGLDTRHNPEFTLLEAYQALADYHDMMELVETIVSRAALAATGSTVVTVNGTRVELAPPWRRATMAQLVFEATGARMHPSMPLSEARAVCDAHGIAYEPGWGAGRLLSEVYDETVEHTLVQPTFVTDHPREVSPLARAHRDDPALVERFEAVVAGRELANAYSELNDPVDQRARFEAEAAAKAAGDLEAGDVDEPYLRALEHGLPPTGGLGIGIDRLVMLVAEAASIRDVILFPALRPEEGDAPTVAAVVAPTGTDAERARALVHAHGDGTLDYFALRDDKQWCFTADGTALVAYAERGRYALASGDPIGPPEARERAIGEFLAWSRERGRKAAFLAVRERDVDLYRAHGLHAFYLGDEAVLRCDRFALDGPAMKGVRAAVHRVGRHCAFRLLHEAAAPPELRAQLEDLRERWRDGADERGFTMELGGGLTGENPDLLLALATGADGRPLGFLRLVPCAGAERGWSLDLMQHDPDAPNGMTEFLVARTAQALAERGEPRLSLNFAAWGRLLAPGAHLSLGQRLERRVAHALDPYFQISSLRQFNAKFDPEWEPRSIVVESAEALPHVALLYAQVEGFVRMPGRRAS